MTTPDAGFGTFFLPGPTEVRPAVLAAMLRPMIPHRGADFEALYARCDAGLRTVFRTERPVYLSSSSATGLMEGAVRAAPAGPILAVVNGAFSERFADIARACGRDVQVLDVVWGCPADPDDVARALRTGPSSGGRFAAVTVVHSETSTGALTDVRAVAAVARAHGVVCLVDSVTGVGGAELHADTWALDFVLTGSQKALALPPGLAFGVASAEFIAGAAARPAGAAARGRYFDLTEFETYAARRQTPNTPALSLFYALDVQLAAMAACEPIEARWARHRAMAEQMWAWVDARAERFGLGVLAPSGARSPTVTTVALPAGLDSAALVRALAARGYTIGAGYGRLRGTTFRVGHMGDHTPETLTGCLAACDDALAELTGH
ncbi:MAG TPA: alanine--glyoxylate aminotransferase family protein [Gemmatirosa sp.]